MFDIIYKQSKIVYALVLQKFCGSGSVVERRLAKANVAGPNPVSRSNTAPSPSGKARACKALTPSSNLGGASIKNAEVAE